MQGKVNNSLLEAGSCFSLKMLGAFILMALIGILVKYLCKCWLVGCFGFNGVSDSISVYIGPSPKEREKEKRKDSGE